MYAEKSIFLSKKQKNEVNNMLVNTFNRVGDYLSGYKCEANLYLSGSLARKEPCIKTIKNRVELTSDIDYVIVCKHMEDDAKFVHITREVNKLCPDFQNSFVVIDEDKIQRIQSFFSRDLSLTFEKPLYKSFDLATIPSYRVDSLNCIESITTQLACYILHPDFTYDKTGSSFFRKSEYHWIKSILESVRLLFIERDVIAYNDVIHYDLISEINHIISKDDLLEIIRSRELTEKCEIGKESIYQFVYDIFVYFFGKSTEKQLCNLMILKIVDQYTCFQYAVLSLFFYLHRKNRIWLKAFADIIGEIQFAPKTLTDNIKESVMKCLNIFDGNAIEEIIVSFRKVRNIYVELLHYKNTQEDVFSDIQQ